MDVLSWKPGWGIGQREAGQTAAARGTVSPRNREQFMSRYWVPKETPIGGSGFFYQRGQSAHPSHILEGSGSHPVLTAARSRALYVGGRRKRQGHASRPGERGLGGTP